MKQIYPRIKVWWLMLVVVVVAINFAIIRCLPNYPHIDPSIARVTLPMASILLLAAPKAWRGDATKPFWIGFEVAGLSMAALFGYLSYRHGAVFFRPANSVYPWSKIRNEYAQSLYLTVLDFVFYFPPQVLVAWFVGRMITKYLSRFKRIPSN